MLGCAQRYTAAIDVSDYADALATLRATHALDDPQPSVKLRFPQAM